MTPETQPTRGSTLHPRILRALQQIGTDISHARRTRRIAAEDFARRIGISRATLHRLESGDPGIALGSLALALHAIGKLDALTKIANPADDQVTMAEMREQVPKRIGKPRSRVPADPDHSGEADDEAAPPSSKFRGF